MNVLKAKKYAKTKKLQQESVENFQITQEKQSSGSETEPKTHMDNNYQVSFSSFLFYIICSVPILLLLRVIPIYQFTTISP